jgi:hypothetical protein
MHLYPYPYEISTIFFNQIAMILNHIQRKVSDVRIKEEPLLKTALINYIDPRIVLRWFKDNAIDPKMVISI